MFMTWTKMFNIFWLDDEERYQRWDKINDFWTASTTSPEPILTLRNQNLQQLILLDLVLEAELWIEAVRADLWFCHSSSDRRTTVNLTAVTTPEPGPPQDTTHGPTTSTTPPEPETEPDPQLNRINHCWLFHVSVCVQQISVLLDHIVPMVTMVTWLRGYGQRPF